MMRAPRPWAFEDFDDGRLHVFVPAAMGAGILLSLGILISDTYRKSGGQRLAERRVASTAQRVAADVVSPSTAELDAPSMRPAPVYVVAALATLGLFALLVPGATWNYLDPGGYVEGIGWMWAVSIVASVFFVRVGFIVAHAVPRWFPLIVAVIGLASTARFMQFAEGLTWVLVVGLGGLTATLLLGYATYRRVRSLESLPAWAWPLFVSAPLIRAALPEEKGTSPRD